MRLKGDENLFVKFYMGSVEKTFESEVRGHPVHVEEAFIQITIPGDPHNQIDTRVNDAYKARFAAEWKAFEANQGQGHEGWLLKTWPVVSAAQVKNLEFLNVHTVEQLAGLTDAQCQKIGMGAENLRVKAKAAVEAAKDGAATVAQAAENKRLNDELELMKAQLAALSQAQSKGPGRPRKEEAAA